MTAMTAVTATTAMTATITDAVQLRQAFQGVVLAHRPLNTAQRPCGAKLPVPHAWALLALRAASEPVSVSVLAERLNIDRSNVSRLSARMEELGEVERDVDRGDRRITRLCLTAHGRQLADHLEACSAERYTRLCADLGDDAAAVIAAFRRFAEVAAHT